MIFLIYAIWLQSTVNDENMDTERLLRKNMLLAMKSLQ